MGNFGWDYPPGVTGGEFAISGPDYESEEERRCSNPDCTEFDRPQSVVVQGYQGEAWWTCETCDRQYEEETEA